MEKENMNIVIVGHVDHGKSTFIGRLLYDTKSLPESVVEEVTKLCNEFGKELKFAYFLDSFEEERSQNITIDTSQIFFKTDKRDYVIIDAPGHVEFVKNMITGASQADAAILIVDIDEGMQEQTKRHAYILSLLGLKQVIVVINKMDKIDYGEQRFNNFKTEVLDFLNRLHIKPSYVIPISAKKGDNIASKSEEMAWYNDLSVLGSLDVFNTKESLVDKPLRFPIQDVYKISDKRILVGTIESGEIEFGDEVVFLPSGKKTVVKSVEKWNEDKKNAGAGESIGVTLQDPLFIERGEVICGSNSDIPEVKDTFTANVFWMSPKSINVNEKITLRSTTQEIDCVIDNINTKINSSSLEKLGENCESLRETEVGTVIIKTSNPIVIENFNKSKGLGRFVLVKDEDVVAGGIILE
jgi:sulfate adenylyltransferase large subunit